MGLVILLSAVFLLVATVLPIWAVIQVNQLREELRRAQRRQAALDEELRRLQTMAAQPRPVGADVPTGTAGSFASVAPLATEPPPLACPPPPPEPAAVPMAIPPAARPAPAPSPTSAPVPAAASAPRSAPHQSAGRNLEQFVGAKLLAWLGGFAGFLAVAFFVKYSFEHDLIPPAVRVAVGFVLGAALVAGGILIRSRRVRVTAHVLSATGIVSLYAVTFTCQAVYHFAPFTLTVTFAIMGVITALAFAVAVRQDAPVVAILGLLGGFLTPVVERAVYVSPAGLFGYVALLDIGLAAVALHRRWYPLVPCAAAGTLALGIDWVATFFTPAGAPATVVIALLFSAFFGAVAEVAGVFRRASAQISWAAATLPFGALALAGHFLTLPTLAARPGLLAILVFGADAFLLRRAWHDEPTSKVHLAGGAVVFALLTAWIAEYVSVARIGWALGAALLFALLHSAFPVVLARHRPGSGPAWGHLFPPLALVLMIVPLAQLPEPSALFWPAVLAVDAAAVGLALATGSAVALAAVLGLTALAAAIAIAQLPTGANGYGALYLVVAGFAAFFFVAGLSMARRFGRAAPDDRGPTESGGPGFGGIAVTSTLLPFALLILMSARLPFPSPSPLFVVAAFLVALALGLTRVLVLPWLPAGALAGLAALELAWHSRHFTVERASTVLAWYLGFHALFAVFPFLFRRRFVNLTGPWAVAACSGMVQFGFTYALVRRAWPGDGMGIVPALFALPPLASLLAIWRRPVAQSGAHLNQVAWYAAATLAFVTLIFPIQFERQWVTIGWALEGAALIWLLRRVPHPGLRLAGVGLLVAAFARLAANPAVLHYHARGTLPVLNWYLYAYGITTVCLFGGARWLKNAPAGGLLRRDRGLLDALGAILAFLLLNLEIADFFGRPGAPLTFEFSGNFARDMAYTIGWALYALVVLVAGIRTRTRAARLAAIGLLGVAVLKLFMHDLAQLAQLYRVGALVGVAGVAIAASLLYQRFAPAEDPAE